MALLSPKAASVPSYMAVSWFFLGLQLNIVAMLMLRAGLSRDMGTGIFPLLAMRLHLKWKSALVLWLQ